MTCKFAASFDGALDDKLIVYVVKRSNLSVRK